MSAKDDNVSLEKTLADIEKRFGPGSILSIDDQIIQQVDVISTGSLALDLAIGVGGIPRGRITEIFGPEMCLDAETFIQYEIRDSSGKRQNHKGGSIEHLYFRFHHLPIPGQGNYPRQQTDNSIFLISSVNDAECIIKNRILDVIDGGEKTCYVLQTTSGYKLTATIDHRILTDRGFLCLGDLKPKDTIFIHNNTPYKAETPITRLPRQEIFVKHHPVAGIKIIEGKYQYHRLRKSRAVIEANLNNLTLEEFIQKLNYGYTDELQFLPKNIHIHHVDGNSLNDSLDNLLIINPHEHHQYHAYKNHNKLRFTIVPDTVESITLAGIRHTYDLHCEFPYNNYVANNIIVHNSGKTTICQHIIAEVQKTGEVGAFIDMEHAIDLSYAQHCGIDIKKMIISQPDYGEQALDIAEALIRSRNVAVVVIDSVAALVPRAEIEGEMGSGALGIQARLMSQAMRKLSGIVKTSNTALIFTNQLRQKIGVLWGSPETTPGGLALKFYASVRLDARRVQLLKSGTDVIGNRTRVKVVKNKVAPPFRLAEFDIMYNKGISKEGDLLDLGVQFELITKRGSFYSYDQTKLGQGRENAKNYLKNDLLLAEKIEKEVRHLAKANSMPLSLGADEEDAEVE